MQNIKLLEDSKILFASPLEDYYFGYYGINPYNKENLRLLSIKIAQPPHAKNPEAIIGYWTPDYKFIEVNRTNSFNYQQGCKLQWLNYSDSKIIYNKFYNDKLVSIIQDLDKNIETELSYPIYDISPNGKHYSSINFQSLKKFRLGYSYNILKEEQNIPYLLVCDLDKNQIRKYLGLADILKDDADFNSIDKTEYWIDHPLFSPDSKSILFYVRNYDKAGSLITNIFTCDINGNNLRKYPSLGNYSHAAWLSDKSFIISCRLFSKSKSNDKKSLLKQIVLPFYRKISSLSIIKRIRNNIVSERYIIFNSNSENYKIIENPLMLSDGHPTLNPIHKELLVTDTYPDYESNRNLILYNIRTNHSVLIAKVFSPNQTSSDNNRCDLHPRWISDKVVCIDNLFQGKRQIVKIDLSSTISKIIQ